MDLREYPLLNTPHLFVILLKVAAQGEASVEDALKRFQQSLELVGEHPPIRAEEMRRRLDMLRRYLTEAGLLARVRDDRFRITPRGREALAKHPAGFDTAELMAYSEFRHFIQSLHRAKRTRGPRNTTRATRPIRMGRTWPTTPTLSIRSIPWSGKTAGSRPATRTWNSSTIAPLLM